MTVKINTEKSRNVYQEAIKMHFYMCVIICSSRFKLTFCFLLQIFLESLRRHLYHQRLLPAKSLSIYWYPRVKSSILDNYIAQHTLVSWSSYTRTYLYCPSSVPHPLSL